MGRELFATLGCHPAVAAARIKVAPAWIMREAERDQKSPLWQRTIFEHPASLVPSPQLDGGDFAAIADGTGSLEADVANIDWTCGFIVCDGSCTRHLIPELSKTSWALAFFAFGGEVPL